MTIIKSVYAKGFKSFAKPTEIIFSPGFSIVLGPNGSGKSNIIDLITFVLGKSSAKEMRAERSANLIYNGGKDNEPASQAEASMVFDNSRKEFPVNTEEVKITRIVKKDGSSTYYLNDQKMNKQQILDVLSAAKIDPDGHNIVLQGDIIRFTQMKGEERRLIIEEISGISVYEDKKQKAMNELDKVQAKLTEIEIVLAELAPCLKR